MSEYQPGVCNIGGAEQRKRYFGGAAGILTGILITMLVLLNIIPLIGLIGAFAAYAFGAEGLLQGFLNFCTGFASKGIYDVSDGGQDRKEVGDETEMKQDRVRALQIHMYSLTSALTLTSFAFLLVSVI